MELLQSFTLKFLKWGISHQPLIRKHSYLDHRYPGGSAFSPWLLTPESMPQGGDRGQNLGQCFSTLLLWQQLMQIVGQTWLNLVTWTCGSWSEGQHDLYFTVQWFCLISWRLFDVWTSNFGIMSQYDPMFDFKIFVGHCDLYFMVQWFFLIAWKHRYMNTILWDYESEWSDVWPQNICRTLWPIFHGPDFAL